MLSERANAICILEILKEYSDKEHILGMKDIILKMQQLYDLKVDRRTVYSAISLLIKLGYDISRYEENGKGYYMRARDFDPSEVRLLSNAVHAFSFVSAKQSEQLIGKLQKQLSVHKRKEYKSLTVVKPDRKTVNRQVFLNIELLDEAIANKKQVSFTYLQYGLDKELHPRREQPYVVNPYRLIFQNEHYYLLCNAKGHEGEYFYRLDRMQDIEILDASIDAESSTSAKAENAIYAFAGEPEYITMHCDSIILGDVIDKFGTDIFLAPVSEEKFMVRFKAPLDGVKFWALQYLSYAEVVEPLWLREEIIDIVRNNPYLKE